MMFVFSRYWSDSYSHLPSGNLSILHAPHTPPPPPKKKRKKKNILHVQKKKKKKKNQANKNVTFIKLSTCTVDFVRRSY